MRVANRNATRKTRHAAFQMAYIWVALITAIFGGFAIGAHLSFVIGYNRPLGEGYASFIQTHGHLQLVGWAGLFIMGISLHFIPRLSSVPISRVQWMGGLPWVMGIGLFLRMVCHSVIPYLEKGIPFSIVSWTLVASGLIEWYGILVYLSLLAETLLGLGKANRRPPLMAVRPYLGMMMTGFCLYASINLILLVKMALDRTVVMHPGWNELAVEGYTSLVLLPVAFAFSVRTFPLYLRLPVADWSVRAIAYLYLFSICLQMSAVLPMRLDLPELYLSSVGMVLRGGIVLWIVWKLEVLTHFQQTQAGNDTSRSEPDRRSTRRKIPDGSEFGRFERIVYAAYVWLALGAFFEMLLGGWTLFGHSLPISADVVRHAYLLGFITNLILGMAVRMIPGFIKKKRIAMPKLVETTFWLANGATVGRLLPLVLPAAVFDAGAVIVVAAETAFAFSGILGLGAVVCLAVNLWKTAHA